MTENTHLHRATWNNDMMKLADKLFDATDIVIFDANDLSENGLPDMCLHDMVAISDDGECWGEDWVDNISFVTLTALAKTGFITPETKVRLPNGIVKPAGSISMLQFQARMKPRALTIPRDIDRIDIAIFILADDGVLTFQKGKYSISDSLLIDRNIHIVSETGDPNDVIIECAEDDFIVFDDSSVTLRGLTFKATAKKCAIFINKGDSTIEDCVFEGGSLGAIISDKGNGQFDNCKFIGNKICGMAVSNQSNPFIKDCHFLNNRRGVIIDGGLGTFENCIINNNFSHGITVCEDGSPTIRNCTIKDNEGAGICISDGGGFFDGNEIRDNAEGSWCISEKSKKISIQRNFWYDREGKQIFYDNIFEAAAKGSVDDVWFFVRQGIDVCSQDDRSLHRGITPLHFAATGNPSIGVLEYLISLGYNINAKDENDRTPLHYAAEWNPSIRILKYLIAQGADVNAEDNNGKTPLDLTNNEEKQTILSFEAERLGWKEW